MILLAGIYVLNHPKIIEYILYFKTVSLKNLYKFVSRVSIVA